MRPARVRLARDAVDLLTGRRPEVRNRVKFFLLSPIYDGLGLDLSPEMLAVGRDKVTRLGLRNARSCGPMPDASRSPPPSSTRSPCRTVCTSCRPTYASARSAK